MDLEQLLNTVPEYAKDLKLNLAVSAINGCSACVDAHGKVLQSKGVGEEVILTAVRIASVVHALAAVFDAEAARVAAPVTA